ncbi:hypothetical protein FQH80_20230 [Escherichia coli]|nr:hypothetical protein [Escherichia coli]
MGFHITRGRGSFAYPFMSPHRLVGVLLRLLTSCFSWCCPYTVQCWRSLSLFFNLLIFIVNFYFGCWTYT